MPTAPESRAILNAGPAAWAFAPLAETLSDAFGVPVRDTPARVNYVLGFPDDLRGFPEGSFIPRRALEIAADKRLVEKACAVGAVPRPTTRLVERFGCVDLLRNTDGAWLALEVGTDGVFNHVDRDVPDEAFLTRLHARLRDAFLAM